MDVDIWPSKTHSSRHLCVVRAACLSSDGRYDDFEGDEDTRACFPCPFCYVEIEIHALCNDSQEEHCFDLKNAVCPLCAANLSKDVIGHFMVHHASSLKRRRKSQKSGFCPGSPATLGRELSSFVESSTGGRVMRVNLHLIRFFHLFLVMHWFQTLRIFSEINFLMMKPLLLLSSKELNHLCRTKILNRIQKREGEELYLLDGHVNHFLRFSSSPMHYKILHKRVVFVNRLLACSSPGCVNQHWVLALLMVLGSWI